MISGTSTRLPIRIVAMSAVLLLVTVAFSGGGQAAAGAAEEFRPATDHRARAR
jgi:hypothetical protein